MRSPAGFRKLIVPSRSRPTIYAFAPNIIAKFEVHNAKGFAVEEPVDVLGGAPLRSNYLITSLSVAF